MQIDTHPHYPGTPQHQAILRAIAAHYENDPRILAVAAFGSFVFDLQAAGRDWRRQSHQPGTGVAAAFCGKCFAGIRVESRQLGAVN